MFDVKYSLGGKQFPPFSMKFASSNGNWKMFERQKEI